MEINDDQLTHLAVALELPDLSGTPYQLRDEVGRGGMGVVYRALDTRLGREVALKVAAEGDSFSEARIAAALEHPSIVPVYDAGVLPGGRGYYTMRLIAGSPLGRYLAANPDLALSQRLAIFQKVTEAAGFAHARGVVHRDLKPANIMVGDFGEVAVLDFGVATRGDGAGDGIVGTPCFMAPEQATGSGASPAADIYSLGALLAWLLPRPGAPRPLRAIAARAQAHSPSERYGSCAALAADIARFQDGLAVSAYREHAGERLARFARRNATLLLLVGAYFAARIFVFFYWSR